jgi:DNA modification methylase
MLGNDFMSFPERSHLPLSSLDSLNKAEITRKPKAVQSQRTLSIRYISPNAVKPNPRNPRIHSEKQIRQIAHSIEAFGFNVPILVDRNSHLIAGHGRFEAAKLLGLPRVPSVSLEHMTEAQAQAFAIADNRLAENSTWDEDLLAEQLKALSEVELEFDLEATGFEMGEIDFFIEGIAATTGAEDKADAIPEETPIQVTALGDLWQLDSHRILCGDALDPKNFAALMRGQLADAMFSDPPYNVPIDGHATGLGRKQHREFAMATGEMTPSEYTDFLQRAFQLQASCSRNGSLHYICIDWRHVRELLNASTSLYGDPKNVCVWVKDNGGMGSLYRSQHEFVFVFKHGKDPHRNNIQLGKFGRYRTNVWNYAGANSFSRSTEEGNLLELHPTVKPVALVADAIMDCTARGEIVLDPFSGSGTTVIAAERTGRICYGLEIDPAYVDIIIRRWQAFTGKVAVYAASGRTFDDLEAEVSR